MAKYAADTNISGPALGDLLGLSVQRIGQLVKKGLPKIDMGQYPVRACIAWYVQFKIDSTGPGSSKTFQAARRRDMEATASMKELKLKKMQRALIPLEEAERAWLGEFIRLKSQLRGIAHIAAPQVTNCKDVNQNKTYLLSEIDRVLLDVSEAPLAAGTVETKKEEADQ